MSKTRPCIDCGVATLNKNSYCDYCLEIYGSPNPAAAYAVREAVKNHHCTGCRCAETKMVNVIAKAVSKYKDPQFASRSAILKHEFGLQGDTNRKIHFGTVSRLRLYKLVGMMATWPEWQITVMTNR